MLSQSVPDRTTDRNPGRVSIRAAGFDRIRGAVEQLYRIAATPGPLDTLLVKVAIGELAGLCDAVGLGAEPIDTPPIALYEPPQAEPEPFTPSPEDAAWAAEHVTPASPRTPEDLLRFVADQMEAIGLEPTVHSRAVDVQHLGREWSLELHDRTTFYQHMEAMAREYDRDPGHLEQAELAEARIRV